MIGAIVRNGLLNLRRDRAALMLTFILPIAFFSIFAVIFGSQNRKTPTVNVAILDEDQSVFSQRLVAALGKESALKIHPRAAGNMGSKDEGAVYTRAIAEEAVRGGDVPVAIILPKGLGEHAISFGRDENRPAITLLADSSDPIAPQLIGGLLQKVSMTAMPDVMAESGMKYFEEAAGGLTPAQRERIDSEMKALKTLAVVEPSLQGAKQDNSNAVAGLLKVETKDLLGEKKKNPIIAFYAAGVGVMFLLFSANGAAGSLLEEAESGALDRTLSTRVTMTKLLLGKLAYLTLLGTAQLTVMFVWGMLVFKVELLSHLLGFYIMVVVTALAASAFGLMLAAASRTRAQQSALATLIILIMSALGGSMFPRFIMSETLQKVGLITFNAWALDGFLKVFWREEPISHLWPQVLVLACAAIIFVAIARRLARKWEYS